MGFDLYAGTLARYATRRWETEAARYARDIGVPFQMNYVGGQPKCLWKCTASWSIERWRKRIKKKHLQSSGTSLDWNESDVVPYWSRKPDHQGRNALVLAGAYAEVESITSPLIAPENYEDDPAYLEVSKNYLSSCVCALEAHMFLPSSDNFTFVEKDPLGSERFVTSTANLKRALDLVNDAHWQAPRSTVVGWAERGPLVAKVVTVENGAYVKEEAIALPRDQFTHAAQFGFAIYSEALDFAELHHAPILTDG